MVVDYYIVIPIVYSFHIKKMYLMKNTVIFSEIVAKKIQL